MLDIKVGDIIEGTIIQIKPYGAIMLFIDGQKGLLHISEIANSFIRNIKRYLTIGKTYQVKVIEIMEDNFLKVSMSRITPEERADFRNSAIKRTPIDPQYIDFTKLNELIESYTSGKKDEN